jgi:hypothetical protein
LKVISIDNHDREHRSDVLIAEGLSLEAAARMAGELNAKADPSGDDYFVAVADDYKLKRFEP